MEQHRTSEAVTLTSSDPARNHRFCRLDVQARFVRRAMLHPRMGRHRPAPGRCAQPLRDRALIALMVYSFARIGAALAMKVEDVFTEKRRLWVRLREKGGKAHAMPCHHSLEEYLHAYLDQTGISGDPEGHCSAPSAVARPSLAVRRCLRPTPMR